MSTINTRQFTRVEFKRDVHLDFNERQYIEHTVNNLSLGGMYVQGDFDQQAGDICTVELSDPAADTGIVELRARASVVWADEEGIALRFLSMGHDSFLFLQTALLYEAEDPVELGAEFVRNISFDLEPEPKDNRPGGEQSLP
ncbi:MAG: PilZ domain-containing protein [Candidatus Electrothrix sp. YB6]